jgi:hypothetical protein
MKKTGRIRTEKWGKYAGNDVTRKRERNITAVLEMSTSA